MSTLFKKNMNVWAVGLLLAALLAVGLFAMNRKGLLNPSSLLGTIIPVAPFLPPNILCLTCSVNVTNITTSRLLQNGVVNLLAFTVEAPANNDVLIDSFLFNTSLPSTGTLLTSYRLKDSSGFVLASYMAVANTPTVPLTLQASKMIPRGTSLSLTLEADAVNVNPGDRIKIGLAPAGITAQCASAATKRAAQCAVTATGGADNKLENTAAGTLTGYSEGNPEPGIAVAGSQQVPVARYRFNALHEPFTIRKLTVINDLSGVFDTPVTTGAITSVTVRYTDYTGRQRVMGGGALANGVATIVLTRPGIEITRNGEVYVDILANVNSVSQFGEALSGKTFRLGIRDTANTAATFEMIGINSQAVSNTVTIHNGNAVNAYVARKTKPTFATTPTSGTLLNAENTLAAFTVTANAAGSVGFGRLVFDVTTNGMNRPGADLNGFKFFIDGTLVPSGDLFIAAVGAVGAGDVTLNDVTGNTGLASANTTASGVDNGTYKVIVSFNQEKSVPAGLSQTFALKAMTVGAAATNSVTTRIATGDEATSVSGIGFGFTCGRTNVDRCSTQNGNTGFVFETGPNEGLFASAADFSRLVSNTGRSVIWSDKSADNHYYPNFSADPFFPNRTGSYDWTNGYLLKLDRLSAQTLTY